MTLTCQWNPMEYSVGYFFQKNILLDILYDTKVSIEYSFGFSIAYCFFFQQNVMLDFPWHLRVAIEYSMEYPIEYSMEYSVGYSIEYSIWFFIHP